MRLAVLRPTHNYCFMALCLVSFMAILQGCGESKSDDPPPTVHGKMTLSESTYIEDNASSEFTTLTKCSRNVDTDRVDISMSAGTDKPSLQVSFKGYSSTPKTYTCLQSADNGTSETSVGGKFESCAISGTVMASVSATTLNSYNMYRETTDTGAFSYSGACSIVVSAASPTITATFDCNKMVQTTVTGRKRFPMSGAPTGTLKGEFKCTF